MPVVLRVDGVLGGDVLEDLGLVKRFEGSCKMKLSTFEALCEKLHCHPSDLLELVTDEEFHEMFGEK